MSDAQSSPTKICSKCRAAKLIEEFGTERRRPDGHRCFCRACGWADIKTYRKANPSRVRGWRRKRNLKIKYNLTPEEFAQMLAAQGGVCALCKTTESHGRYGCFVIDHDHDTGRVRGILCNQCNLALGQLGDSEDGILRAIAYLRG